jgi:hypothetical protein
VVPEEFSFDWSFLSALRHRQPGNRTAKDPGGTMLTIALGILIAVFLLFAFGFLWTASTGWFFKYRKPQDTFPASDKN